MFCHSNKIIFIEKKIIYKSFSSPKIIKINKILKYINLLTDYMNNNLILYIIKMINLMVFEIIKVFFE